MAQYAPARRIGGQFGGFFDVVCNAEGGEVAKPSIGQVGIGKPLGKTRAHERYARHAHPNAFAGGGAAHMRQRIQRDIHFIVVRHVLATNADKFDPVRIYIAGGKGSARVFQEGRAARFGADEDEARIGDTAQHRRPGINTKRGVFVGVVGGAEGDIAAPILGRFKVNRHFVKAKPPANRHPGFRQFKRLFNQQARVFRFDVGINQDVINRLKPC